MPFLNNLFDTFYLHYFVYIIYSVFCLAYFVLRLGTLGGNKGNGFGMNTADDHTVSSGRIRP